MNIMIKKIVSLGFLSLLFFVTAAFVNPPAKSISLRYKLSKNQLFEMNISTRQTISMTMGEQSINILQNVTLDQDAKVADVTENNSFVMDITYKRIQFNQNAMGMEITWDSDNQSENESSPMVQQIAAQLNKTIGKTIQVGIDNLGNATSNNKSDVLGETNISGFETGMLVVFPENEVKVGDSWEVTVKPDPANDYSITSVYKLTAIKGKKALISFEGKVSGSEAGGSMAIINGSISGNSEVDIATGWLLKASVHQDMTMEMEQQGEQVPMKLSSFIELTTK